MAEIPRQNLLSPIALAFALGTLTKLVRSEFSLPKDISAAISVYLLFALGLKGGIELAHATFAAIRAWPRTTSPTTPSSPGSPTSPSCEGTSYV